MLWAKIGKNCLLLFSYIGDGNRIIHTGNLFISAVVASKFKIILARNEFEFNRPVRHAGPCGSMYLLVYFDDIDFHRCRPFESV